MRLPGPAIVPATGAPRPVYDYGNVPWAERERLERARQLGCRWEPGNDVPSFEEAMDLPVEFDLEGAYRERLAKERARRDSLSLFLPGSRHPRVLHPDERLTEAQCRAGVRKLWHSAPKDTKSQLARLCGYSGRWALHTLRGIVKGRAALPDACRRRISRVLSTIERGHLELAKTLQSQADGKPVCRWKWTEEAQALAHWQGEQLTLPSAIPLPRIRPTGRPRKGGDVGSWAS
jgi:hypothetical protein